MAALTERLIDMGESEPMKLLMPALDDATRCCLFLLAVALEGIPVLPSDA